MSSGQQAGTNLVAAFALARMALLVLVGRASANVAALPQDQHRVGRRSGGYRIDVVLAGSIDVETGRRGLLVVRQDDDPASSAATPKTVADDIEAQRMAGDRVRPPTRSQTTSTTLVLAGLIGLFGVTGAAAFLVHSLTGPVRRAALILQSPEESRPGHRLRLTTGDELSGMSRTPATDGHGLLDAVRETGADQSPEPVVVSAGAEQVTNVPPIAPDVAETSSVLPVIAHVVRQAQLAFDATGVEEPVQEVAKVTGAMTTTSTPSSCSVGTARYAAARSRALGPTTALWHAVQLDRLVDAIEGSCETTVCGSLVRLSTEQTWPVAARDVCPACATLAH